MKDIISSKDKELSEAARKCAADEAIAFIEEMRKSVRTGGRKFTRDEMNER